MESWNELIKDVKGEGVWFKYALYLWFVNPTLWPQTQANFYKSSAPCQKNSTAGYIFNT